MRCYKLTDKDGQTHGGCQWGEGVTHETSGEGELCGSGWLHAYSDPILAVLMNPVHGDFAPRTMLIWEANGEGEYLDDHGLKYGFTKLTTIRQIPVPVVTTQQRVRFANLCAMAVAADARAAAKVVARAAWVEAEAADARAAAKAAARAAEWAVAWASTTIDFVALAHEAVPGGGDEQ